MLEEERFLIKHLLDLSRKSARINQVLYSDFLNLNEIDLFISHGREMDTTFKLYGGYEEAERQMIGFIPDALSLPDDLPDYPITSLLIRPKHIKYAETLSHRDILGACMGLKIDRRLLGDILVREQESFLFCCTRISGFLIDGLTKIKHTEVKVTPFEDNVGAIAVQKQPVEKSVVSMRLDCIAAAACNLSRTETSKLIQAKSVFVNSRNITKADYICSENDIISVRGYGKFSLGPTHGTSKKGKLRITILKYI